MKKIFKIVLVLSLCFFIKAQAQQTEWTQEQISQVGEEIEWIKESISINEQQQDFLQDILLEKNEMLESNTRIEWRKKIVLDRMEDIIRYGKEINRHPEHGDTQLPTEIHSVQEFETKIRKNQELLEKLNLNALED